MQLIDIELKMPLQSFEHSLNDFVSQWSSAMNYHTESVSTKKGRKMYKVEIFNDNNSTAEIVAEKDDVTGDIHFYPFKLRNMGESFYKFSFNDNSIIGTDEDPSLFMCYALEDICKNNKATLAYIDTNNNAVLIKDGVLQSNVSLGIVDSRGNVYSTLKAKSINDVEDDDNVDFHVKTPINEWLSDHREIATAISKMPLNQKMDYIGKSLIQLRVNNEIDASEFADIFCQAGLFGFSDKSILNIYKLFM